MLHFIRGELMTGYEYIKQKRIEKGYTIRQFGKVVNIIPRMISYYEAGEKPIEHISLNKMNKMFDVLEIDIEDFFDCYYPYKHDMDLQIVKWRCDNPVECDFQIVKKKIYARLAQIKSRGTIEESKLKQIYDMYDDFFCNEQRKFFPISTEEYNKFVNPILYQIKLNMSGGLPENDISRSIMIAFYQSGYKIKDVSKICGITSQNLNYYINGKYDYGSLHVDTALKLCYLLKLDFKILFESCEKSN